MATKNTIAIEVAAEVRKARQGIDQVNTSLGGLEAAGKRASKVGRNILGGAAAYVGVRELGSALMDCTSEAREAQKVNALTANTIKATGGAANTTAAEVGKLTESISNKTGIDDEAIQAGSNLLLTFKNVRNEVGKGNAVFDRATQSAVDLSASGFGSIEGASKTVGKALNDPVKGISALGRAGVTFTEQQKEQIATLVKSGKTLEAQKIILGEVESQVGGNAAASATAGEKFQTMVANIKESIGTKMLPILDRVQEYLIVHLPGWIGTAESAFGKLVFTFETIAPVAGPVLDLLIQFGPALLAGATAYMAINKGIALYKSAVVAARAAQIALNLAMTANPIGLVVAAIAALVAGLVYAYQHSEKFRKIVNAALRGAVDGARALWEGTEKFFGKVAGLLDGLVSGVQAGVGKVIDVYLFLPRQVIAAIKNPKKMLYQIGEFITDGLVDGIKAAPGKILDAVGGIADKVKGGIKGALGINSPAKAIIPLGESVSEGMGLGILLGQKHVENATKKLTKKTQSDIDQWTRKTAAMQNKAYEKVVAAKEKLTELIQARTDYANSVRDNARDFAKLSTIEVGENETRNAGTLAQGLRDRLASIINFNDKLAQLKSMGISDSLYDQIVAEGVESGTGLAEALTAGGPAALQEINNLQASVDAQTQRLGNNTAATMHNAGIQAAQGLVTGLQSQLDSIVKTANKFAKALVKAVKKALGIKSPSRVFAEIGGDTVAGLERGLDMRKVANAGVDLSTALTKGFGTPALSAPSLAVDNLIAGGTDAGTVQINLNVMVPVGASAVDIGRELVEYLEAYINAGGRRVLVTAP